MNIYELLKSLRRKANLTLTQAAAKAGVSISYIRILEGGIRPISKTPITPSPEILKKLAEAYDYPFEDLMIKAGHLSSQYVFDFSSKTDAIIRPQTIEETQQEYNYRQKLQQQDLESMIDNADFLSYRGKYIDEDTKSKIKGMLELLLSD